MVLYPCCCWNSRNMFFSPPAPLFPTKFGESFSQKEIYSFVAAKVLVASFSL